jgi:MFS family permease
VTAASPRAALRHPDFVRYLGASFLSSLGAQMMGVAVGWQVYAVTHRPLDLGWVGLAQFVPSFLLSPLAGHAADRLDRARLVAASDLALAVCALALFAASARGLAGVAPIYAVLVVAGAARALGGPAGQAVVPGLVPAGDLAGAVTWSSGAWQVSTIVGPAAGGALYAALHGAAWVYAAAAVSLALASALAFAIRTRSAHGPSEGFTARTVLAGLRYVRARRILLGCISLDLFAVLLGGATALLPVYASDVLHVGPTGLGVLRAAPAAGAALVAIALGVRPLSRRAGPAMLACVALFGAATVVFGASRSVPLSVAALLVLGAADMVSVVVRSTVIQLETPEAMRGRVSAVNAMFIAGSSELGELESGVTAALLGAVPAVILGGVGTLVVVAAYALLFPEIRAVDRLDGAQGAEGASSAA